MKKRFFYWTLCLSLLLSGCGGSADPAPDVPESPPPAETPVAAPDAPADLSDAVFDTAQDAGRLTARYLSMTQMYSPAGQEIPISTGDSTVYTSPEGQVLLVDCGNALGGQEVVDQLRRMDVSQIDVLVLSHPHADHIGGFCTVADAFPIGKVYTNGHEYDSQGYRDVMDKIQELDIPCEILREGDSFSFGSDVLVEVYGPAEGATQQVAAGAQDANDCSIAMRLTYGDSSFWTSGDLYTTAEKRLAEDYGAALHTDIVKMDHHGKDTSNCKAFVEALSPRAAVGLFDSIASQTVSARYLASGAKIYYNFIDGAVRISTSGDGTYDVQTQLLRDLPSLPEPPSDGHEILS